MSNKPESGARLAPATGSLTQVQEAANLIADKMRRERPTLRQYLRERASGECRSSKEWAQAGAKEQAAYRAGSSNAYLDVERMIERDGFAPENH